jgi:hypothetical protein
MPILVILNKVCFGTVGANDMVEKGFDGCRLSNTYYSNDFSHSFYEQNSQNPVNLQEVPNHAKHIDRVDS